MLRGSGARERFIRNGQNEQIGDLVSHGSSFTRRGLGCSARPLARCFPGKRFQSSSFGLSLSRRVCLCFCSQENQYPDSKPPWLPRSLRLFFFFAGFFLLM